MKNKPNILKEVRDHQNCKVFLLAAVVSLWALLLKPQNGIPFVHSKNVSILHETFSCCCVYLRGQAVQPFQTFELQIIKQNKIEIPAITTDFQAIINLQVLTQRSALNGLLGSALFYSTSIVSLRLCFLTIIPLYHLAFFSHPSFRSLLSDILFHLSLIYLLPDMTSGAWQLL